MSQKEIKSIFIYYSIIFIFSLIAAGIIVCKYSNSSADNLGILLVISFICGLLGSTFYYIRKLYKSCIQFLVETEKEGNSIAAIGAKVYFYFRPIMGATLSAFIVLGIYGGFFCLQDQPSINTERFFVFSAVVSFVVGFSNGNIIVSLDKNREKITELIKIGKEDGNNDT